MQNKDKFSKIPEINAIATNLFESQARLEATCKRLGVKRFGFSVKPGAELKTLPSCLNNEASELLETYMSNRERLKPMTDEEVRKLDDPN